MNRLHATAKAWPFLVMVPLMALMAQGKLGGGKRELPLGYMVGCFEGGESRAILGADQSLLIDKKLFQISKLLEENGHYRIETTPAFDVVDGKVVPSHVRSGGSFIDVFHHGAPGAAIRFVGANSTAQATWLKKGCGKS
jgi:hypothetical protein